MKVLKHGNRIKDNIFICPECGCEFIPGNTEILRLDGEVYARCPECTEKVYPPEDFVDEETELEKRRRRREEVISAILGVLEIRRIHIAMEALHWTWYDTNGVPTEEQIQDEIIRQLRSAWDNKRDFVGGGLEIKYLEADENSNEGLRFKFCFEDFGAFHSKEGNIQYIP